MRSLSTNEHDINEIVKVFSPCLFGDQYIDTIMNNFVSSHQQSRNTLRKKLAMDVPASPFFSTCGGCGFSGVDIILRSIR